MKIAAATGAALQPFTSDAYIASKSGYWASYVLAHDTSVARLLELMIQAWLRTAAISL